ncbi:hypothetical protein B0H10DRAFT_1399995 [Mycena sp. CBHHK59/15]|nr:hypothetical protein B0H10DRAFT_1399995 [Mycena sp. CBHHK59/15]
MYFGRGAYDPASVEEAQGRLKAFAGGRGLGAMSILGGRRNPPPPSHRAAATARLRGSRAPRAT